MVEILDIEELEEVVEPEEVEKLEEEEVEEEVVVDGEEVEGTEVDEEEVEEELIEDIPDYSAFAINNDALLAIADDVQLLADSSLQGYLSTSIVEVFDRLVDSRDYKYYVAFRDGEDANSGVIYLSNNCDGSNTMSDCQVVNMYRVNQGQGFAHTYHYDISYDSVESFNFNNGALYYTNIATGYPTLGSPMQVRILDMLPILGVILFTGCMLIRRKVKEC